MTEGKKALMREAQNYCDEKDKSTEFMIQYMMDTADATHDEVMEFLVSQSNLSSKEKKELGY